MKTATVVVFLLFAFTTKSCFFGVATATNTPVLDSDGDELRAGVEYYVVSAIPGNTGGGLAFTFDPRTTCPETVVQRQLENDYGIPVTFSNSDTNDDVIRLSTDINIEFLPIRPRLCVTSTVWKLANYDLSTGKWWVITDGVKGNPGANTLTSWFKIEKFEKLGYSGYIFSFCPSVCESCITLCSNIGRAGDNGLIRLALDRDDLAWPFVFKKATPTIKQVVNAQN
ncbi:hypothetical protein DITRI_Ditri04bG0201200 [Diplodiscus trichospermus]